MHRFSKTDSTRIKRLKFKGETEYKDYEDRYIHYKFPCTSMEKLTEKYNELSEGFKKCKETGEINYFYISSYHYYSRNEGTINIHLYTEVK